MFLNAFELNRMGKEDMVGYLAPLLSGLGHFHPSGQQWTDYDLCKQALLQKFKLTPEAYSRRFWLRSLSQRGHLAWDYPLCPLKSSVVLERPAATQPHRVNWVTDSPEGGSHTASPLMAYK